MNDVSRARASDREDMPDRLALYNQWTLDAMTALVNFAAITLEPARPDDIPRHIVEFLSQPFLDLSYAGILQFDLKEGRWKVLAAKGKTNADFDSIPTFEGTMILEEEREIYSFFSLFERSFLVVATRHEAKPPFSPQEKSFMSLFSTLVSSFYQMKILSREVEEKIVEMSTLSASNRLIKAFNENTVRLEDVFLELHDSLSLEGIVVALTEPGTDRITVTATRGFVSSDWEEALRKIYTDEKYFPEEWELFPLFDEHMLVHGAIICHLSRQNPTLYAIQHRVFDYTIGQIVTILNQRQFHVEALSDPLTGLANRRHLMKTLKDRIRTARLDPLTKLSVAMVDIDHFKQVNDTYGHQAGDAVLKAVASAISSALRGTDLAGRYGGEEFLVILQTGRKGAYKVAERIRRNIEKTKVKHEGKTITVTASVGYTSFSGITASPEELVARADAYLYQAKESGRNRVAGDKIDEG